MFKARKYNWLSSIQPDTKLQLDSLQSAMVAFYSKPKFREGYNRLLAEKDILSRPNGAEKAFLEWLAPQKVNNILEVGCGLGYMWDRISQVQGSINYTGIEVSEQIIESNAVKWPEAHWHAKSVYNISELNNQFDLVFSMYVLEHLVYPEKALDAMLQAMRPHGKLLLVFPDFQAKGSFPSQKLGIGLERTAFQKIKKGKLLDGIISFLESRIFLPARLKKLQKHPGQFMINITPVCLDHAMNDLWPDADAVFVAGKMEVEKWASTRQLTVSYPFGKSGFFKFHAFMVLEKESNTI